MSVLLPYMKKLVIFFILVGILAIIPQAFAEISQFSIDFTISVGKVYVVQEVLYENKSEFGIEIPEDATEISLAVDGSNYKIPDSRIFKVSGRDIKLVYLTKQFIDKNNFLIELTFPDKIKNLSVTLNVPSYMELAKPLEQKTLASNAIFPKASSITTDGQRIIISWERNNLEKNDSISFLVMLKKKPDYSYIAYILAAVVIILVIYIVLRKPKTKVIVKTRTAKIEEHLKEDEEQIVKILKSREGQCEQGTLRVVTGFSKAKLSGLLKELEDRKIIYKEKRGKKNIVFLK